MKNPSILLTNEIERCFNELSGLRPGTQEYNSVLENLNMLYHTRIDETKNDLEYLQQVRALYVKCAVEIGLSLVQIIAYGSWFKKGIHFETTGTYTSDMLKRLINFLKPIK